MKSYFPGWWPGRNHSASEHGACSTCQLDTAQARVPVSLSIRPHSWKILGALAPFLISFIDRGKIENKAAYSGTIKTIAARASTTVDSIDY